MFHENNVSQYGLLVLHTSVPAAFTVTFSYLCFVPTYHHEGMPVVFGCNFNVCLNQLQALALVQWRLDVP